MKFNFVFKSVLAIVFGVCIFSSCDKTDYYCYYLENQTNDTIQYVYSDDGKTVVSCVIPPAQKLSMGIKTALNNKNYTFAHSYDQLLYQEKVFEISKYTGFLLSDNYSVQPSVEEHYDCVFVIDEAYIATLDSMQTE